MLHGLYEAARKLSARLRPAHWSLTATTRCAAAVLLVISALAPELAHAVDLQVSSFTDNPDPATRGGAITFSVSAENADGDTAHDVVLTYVLPANTVFVSAADSTAPGACLHDGASPGTVTCSYPSLLGTLATPAGTRRDITVVLKTTGATVATLNSTVTITSPDVDANLANNTLSQNTTINNGADLTAALSGSPNPAVANGLVTWTVSGSNLGPNASGAATFTTTLPGTLTYVSAGSGNGSWSCSASGQIVTCTTGVIAAGAYPSFPIVTQVVGVTGGTVTLNGSISSSVGDPNPSNNAAVANVSVNPGTDLAITQSTPTPNPVISNSAVTFLLQPSNLGPDAATAGATVTFPLPAGFVVTSNTGSAGWTCSNSGSPVTVSCVRSSSIASGANATLTIVATAPSVSSTTAYNNITATIAPNAGGPADVNSANNSASQNVSVAPDGADLSISKSKSPSIVAFGSTINSVINVSNAGPRTAASGTVTVVDALDPTKETYSGFSGTNWVCVSAPPDVNCTYNAALGIGSASWLTINTISAGAGTATNTATASYSGTPGDFNLTNNSASASIAATATNNSPDLAMSIVAATAGGVQTRVEANETSITYTAVLTNRNIGTSAPAKDAVLVLSIPGRLNATNVSLGSVVVANTSGTSTATFNCTGTGTGSNGNLTCTQNTGTVLTPGDTVTFTYSAARALQDGSFTASASVASSSQGDPDASNNVATVGVTIDPIADVEVVSKVLAASTVKAGTNATYTITVRNNGPSSAAGVSLADVFTIPGGDSGFTFISASANGGGSCSGLVADTSYTTGTPTESCSWPGQIGNGSSVTVTIVIRPNWQAGTGVRTLGNVATVSTTTAEDSVGGTGAAANLKSATLTIDPAQVDMLINDSDLVDPLGYDPVTAANNDITYLVNSANNGPSLATGTGFTFVISPPSGRTATFRGDGPASNAASANPTGTIAGSICNQLGSSVTGPATLTVTCTYPAPGQLANGATTNRYLVVRVGSAPNTGGDVYSTSATAFLNETDPNTSNNTEAETTTVRVRADISIVKTASINPVQLRQPFTWNVAVTNNGPGDSQTTGMTDTLPAGTAITGPVTWSVAGGASGNCTVSGQLVICAFGVLTAGRTAVVTIPALVNSYPSGGTSQNCAAASTSEVDPNSANNLSVCTNLTVQRSSLTGTVFEDRDRTGANAGSPQAAGVEPRIAGVAIQLSGTDAYGNTVLLNTTSNSSGVYTFTDLSPASPAGYLVTETQPTGYVNSPGTPAAFSAGGNYAAGGTGNSTYAALTLGANTAGTGYDFPEVRRPSLSGFVYVDANLNGTKDGSDAAIAGATVRLLDATTLALVASTATNASGAYTFASLDPLIVYTLEEPLPATPAGLGNGPVTPGSINGAACASGCTAQANTPTAGTDRIASIDLSAGLDGTAFNFGEQQLAGINGTVYIDRNRDNVLQAAPADGRLPGVTITLYSGSTCSGTVYASTTTDPNGNYSIGGALAGQTYTVCESQPAGYSNGVANPGANGAASGPHAITITNLPSAGSASNNFGVRLGSLSGFVYLDANNDGIKQGGETAIAGVTVTLSGTDAAGTAVSRVATTDSSGAYRFDDLLAADASGYTLTEQTLQPVVGAVTTLNGKTSVGTVAGSANGVATPVTTTPSAVSAIHLPAGGDSTANNFGEIAPVALRGLVFIDINNNGVQNLPGDSGLAGVTIVVSGVDDNGTAVNRTLPTATDGSYALIDLRPGTYTATEPAQPTGTSNGQTIAGSAGGTATPPATLPSAIAGIVLTTPGTTASSNNFAEIPNTGSISGRVWLDANNNGVIDATEAGIAGVTIQLTGTDAGGGAVTRTLITDATGAFNFANLSPGSYAVSEPTQPVGTINGKTLAGSAGGTATSPSTPISAVSAIVLAVGQTSIDNHFGELPPAGVSGRVYADNNNNGVIDTGETGLAGVTVVLTGTDDLGATVKQTATSTADGSFAFDLLRPGTYGLTEPTQPVGTVNGITSTGPLGGTATSPAVTPSSIANLVLPPGGRATANNFGEIGSSPDLLVSKDHALATFTVANAASYRIRVRNAGNLPTIGTYTVSDALPGGITLAGTPGGTGWACVGAAGAGSFTCTSATVVAAGAGNPNPIDVAVNVGAAAATNSPVSNAVMVDGGGEIDARRPSASERDQFASNPGGLPVCASAISHNACRDPAPVQRAASLSGTAWYDIGNAPNVLDGGDTRLAGWTVEVVNPSTNAIVRSTTTSDTGTYKVVDLLPGVAFAVRFRDPRSGVVFGYPVNGESAPGSSGASCNEAQALANGTASSCVARGTSPQLTVVLAAGQELTQQSLPVDPSGVIYDSGTRQPVPGSVVTLTPAASCAGFDAATAIVGAGLGGYTVTGSSTSMTVGANGFYQFLFGAAAPAACPFTITVAPPAGYTFASTAIAPQAGTLSPVGGAGTSFAVQPQPGAPSGAVGPATTYYLTVTSGSATASIVNNHIPLDAALPAGLSLSKTGDKSVAEVGDSVRYSVAVQITTGALPRQVTVVDRLPAGFTYIRGTTSVNGTPIPDPVGGLGPTLAFNLGNMPATGKQVLMYRLRVGVGSQQGDGINRAQAFGCGLPAGCVTPAFTASPGSLATNEGQHRVRVVGGVFAADACVVGKIFVDCNGNHVQDPEELGIPGVRLVMQDGTTLVSDSEGKYSYCGLPPRSAVLKVDAGTLPKGSRLTTSSNRNLGDAMSLWLDLKNGELHRADFVEGSCSNNVLEQVKARRAQGEIRAPEVETKASALRFDSKAHGLTTTTSPQEGTDSADQRVTKPRGAPPSPPPPPPPLGTPNQNGTPAGGSNATR